MAANTKSPINRVIKHNEEEVASSPGSRESSSPPTPTNKALPKLESSPPKEDVYSYQLGEPGVGYTSPPTMLLPPSYMELKAPQNTPEGISLSNYVKLMTLQQQSGNGGGRFPPVSFGGEPPQYGDMGYRTQYLLMNQAQQLAGLQHPGPLPKQSSVVTSKPAEDKPLVYQQGPPFCPQRKHAVKRPHEQTLEEEQELELVDRGVGLFPKESGRDDRRVISDLGERTPHQLKWRAHMIETWQEMCDAALIDLPNVGFHVETDKGFNFSIIDDSFVCQKKNHFQVTVSILFHRAPKFVKLKNGSIQPIEKFSLHLHGIRFEQVNSHIQLEQSRSDRSKTKYQPDKVDIPDSPDKSLKRTVCRLHFSETTQNNMRKRGKPNPDQKYFSLVVSLQAVTPEGSLPVVAHISERIIVRASNPGNFDNDSDYLWYRASHTDSIFHHGRVGVNTDKPDEALAVHGNIQVTGQIMQLSDRRLKTNIQPVSPGHHLSALSRLQLYSYSMAGESHTGLLAQEVMEVFPQAVKTTETEIKVASGTVSNVLMVDKDQLLMEAIGALQELNKTTGELNWQVKTLKAKCCSLSKEFWRNTIILLIVQLLVTIIIVLW